MGALWSHPRGDDYERILSDLTARIQELEVQISETRLSERRGALWIVLYGALLYVLFVLYVFVYPRGPATISYRPLLDALACLGGPVFIYYTRRLVGWLYARRIAGLEAQLRSYRAKQRLKVEELKKITAYYKTKGLIERFGAEGAEDGEQADKTGAGVVEAAGAARAANASSRTQAYAASRTDQIGVAEPAAAAAPAAAVPPAPPTWLDRLVDVVIGDDRQSRFALICQKCHSHNGLARPESFDSARTRQPPARHLTLPEYICPSCHHLNIPRPRAESGDTSPANEGAADLTPKQSAKKAAALKRRSRRRESLGAHADAARDKPLISDSD